MLKSCKYCGRVHEANAKCTQKKTAEERRWKNRKQTRALQFRRTCAWTEKSRNVRARDNYMCVCCKAMLPGTTRQYNTTDLSVHHITPIEEDYDLRLSEDNLITVCGTHHEMCEAGAITRDTQRMLARGTHSTGAKKEEECICR